MTQEFTTRDDAGGLMLLDAISLYGQRQAVQIALRKQVNNLSLTVEVRKQLYADLVAKEEELNAKIGELLPHLTLEDMQQLKARYEKDPVCAT